VKVKYIVSIIKFELRTGCRKFFHLQLFLCFDNQFGKKQFRQLEVNDKKA